MTRIGLVCMDGTHHYPIESTRMRCPDGQILEAHADWEPDRVAWARRPLGVWRYREMLPLPPGAEVVTLGEGGTGLHHCPRIAEWIGVDDLYVKNEGENPTGSFKDRGMTVGVSLAKALGHDVVGCASTGNTAASLAAYGARAGLKTAVVVPAGKVALGKLAQSVIHGARVLALEGNFDEALDAVDKLGAEGALYLLNSINPLRLEGQKTLVWEVLDQMADQTGLSGPEAVPDRVVYPVGNAGNISAAHKGLMEWKEHGIIADLPRLTGVQAEGAAPFAHMMRSGNATLETVAAPETVATAIRIGNPVSWPKARRAVEETGGTVTTVADDAILEAQRALASKDGIFVEPASAASLAGLRRLVSEGVVDRSERIVCVTTGNGLKDPDAVLGSAKEAIRNVAVDINAIRQALQD